MHFNLLVFLLYPTKLDFPLNIKQIYVSHKEFYFNWILAHNRNKT